MLPLMSVPCSGSRAFRTARAACWCRRFLGLATAELNVSSRNVTPTPCGAADLFQGGGGPRPALDHFRKQGQANRNDPAILGQSLHRLVEERFLLFREVLRATRPKARPKAASTLRAWIKSNRSTGGRVLALEQLDPQCRP